MRRLPWVHGLGTIACVLATGPLWSADALAQSRATAATADRNVDPRADTLVHKMSDYLAAMQSFRFVSVSVDEKVTKDGQKVQFVSNSNVAVRRPNRLRSDRLGPESDVIFRYDGKEISVYGKRTGFYATAPAPGKLDDAIDATRERYGIDAPAADLLLSRPYDGLMEDVTTGRYIGLEPIDGVNCHHLAFQAKDVDWQLWIQDGGQPIPRRYVITSKKAPSAPEFIVSISGWEPNATLPDELFSFQAPPEATRVNFISPGSDTKAAPRVPAKTNKEQSPER
jgi:hypothetical protein